MFKKIIKTSCAFYLLFFSFPLYSMTDAQYYEAMQNQNKYHAYLLEGDSFKKRGDYRSALECYTRAFNMSKNTSLETVSRGELIRIFELMVRYNEALEHVEWFLDGLKKNEPLYRNMIETKQRLLRKVEAQKRGEKVEEPKPAPSGAKAIRNVADFETASYADQKEYLEKKIPENTSILKLSKQALLAEHAGKFADAKMYYEQLLSRREDVTAAQGEVAWPMLHCAVQRMSELTGDEAREKEMLLWIKPNMLDPQGQFHQYLVNLMPDVIDHLNKQIKKYQL